MVEIGQENQRGKSQAWFFEPWYFKDWWIECESEGKDTFSYDSYLWNVIHMKEISEFGKEELGFTLGIVADVASGIVPELCNRFTLVF